MSTQDEFLTIRVRREVVAEIDEIAKHLAANTDVGTDGAKVSRTSVIDRALHFYKQHLNSGKPAPGTFLQHARSLAPVSVEQAVQLGAQLFTETVNDVFSKENVESVFGVMSPEEADAEVDRLAEIARSKKDEPKATRKKR